MQNTIVQYCCTNKDKIVKNYRKDNKDKKRILFVILAVIMLLGICISTAFAADTDNIEWILRYGGDCGKSNLSAEWQYHTHNQSVSDKYHNNRFTLTAGYGANAGVMENYVHKNYDFYSQYFDCKCGRLQRRRKCRYQRRCSSCTVPCRLVCDTRLISESKLKLLSDVFRYAS